jgi:hypothetical protein
VNSLPDYLQPLEFFSRPFPLAAMEAAVARRDESIPHLLHALEWADAHPDAASDGARPYMLHLFALFLLAQFREQRAYPLVVRLFRNPQCDNLVGDVTTSTFHRILVSVYDGDTRPIEALIEDPNVDEWVRSGAVNSLGVLLHTGERSREEISAYLRTLLRGRLEREPSHVWDSIVAICADFGMAEHLDDVRQLYREGLADPFFDTQEDAEREIALPPGASTRVRWERYDLIDSAIQEMEWWHCFEPESERRNVPSAPATPVRRESPKIGRNELCPCGSGKKYKKCCGRSVGS